MSDVYIVGDVQTDSGQYSSVDQFSLRPATFLLIVSACYNITNPKQRLQTISLWLYQSIVVLLFLIYLVRVFAYNSNSVITFISSCLATMYCFGNCFICWKAFSRRYGHVHRAVKLWNQTVCKMIHEGIAVNFGYFRKCQYVLVGVAVGLQVTSVISQFFITYYLLPSSDELRELGYNTSYAAPLPDTTFTRFILTLPVCFQMIGLIGPAFYLIIVSVMLRTGFRGFTGHLEKLIQGGGSSDLLDQLEGLRLIHIDLCQVVSILDQDLCYLYGNVYFWTLGMGIVILYVLVKFPQSLLGALVFLFYLGLTVGMMLSTSIYAAFVHEEAHSPLQTIYYINVKKTTPERSSQLNLFLSKLTGTQVGFTTFGLLTITKEFILTIAGVFLTYFAVLYTTV